jgi:hypothetical protein
MPERGLYGFSNPLTSLLNDILGLVADYVIGDAI